MEEVNDHGKLVMIWMGVNQTSWEIGLVCVFYGDMIHLFTMARLFFHFFSFESYG